MGEGFVKGWDWEEGCDWNVISHFWSVLANNLHSDNTQ